MCCSYIYTVAVNFREDGSSEVQLGETRVMGLVTAQLVPPYRDRPNEGTLAIFTEFSPMADPAFQPGRPGESAIELGRVIDRGLRSPGLFFVRLVKEFQVWSVTEDYLCFSGRAEPWTWSRCVLSLGSMSGPFVSTFMSWITEGMGYLICCALCEHMWLQFQTNMLPFFAQQKSH
jgi:hypothetical protein